MLTEADRTNRPIHNCVTLPKAGKGSSKVLMHTTPWKYMTVELYLHEPLISEMDVGQHHNRGETRSGWAPQSVRQFSTIKKNPCNSQDLKLIPVHPVPNELSPKTHLHTTNENVREGRKGTRGASRMGWSGGGGEPSPQTPNRTSNWFTALSLWG